MKDSNFIFNNKELSAILLHENKGLSHELKKIININISMLRRVNTTANSNNINTFNLCTKVFNSLFLSAIDYCGDNIGDLIEKNKDIMMQCPMFYFDGLIRNTNFMLEENITQYDDCPAGSLMNVLSACDYVIDGCDIEENKNISLFIFIIGAKVINLIFSYCDDNAQREACKSLIYKKYYNFTMNICNIVLLGRYNMSFSWTS